MDKDFPNRVLAVALVLASLALAGCGTPAAKNFGGSWKPVNRFQDKPTEITLAPIYTFYASPMDETLKAMLTRWAKDSGRGLSYKLPFDVTLYKPVSSIRTSSIGAATAQLNSIYAAQGVFVTANDRLILAEPANATDPSAMQRDASNASRFAARTSGK